MLHTATSSRHALTRTRTRTPAPNRTLTNRPLTRLNLCTHPIDTTHNPSDCLRTLHQSISNPPPPPPHPCRAVSRLVICDSIAGSRVLRFSFPFVRLLSFRPSRAFSFPFRFCFMSLVALTSPPGKSPRSAARITTTTTTCRRRRTLSFVARASMYVSSCAAAPESSRLVLVLVRCPPCQCESMSYLPPLVRPRSTRL